MGCGSSSLKGDAVPDLTSNPTPATQPVRRVQTNFSTVDYDQDTRQRRMTEYAPDETPKAKEESHDPTNAQNTPLPQLGVADGQSDPSGGAGKVEAQGDMTLKPYQTIDGAEWDNDASMPAQTAMVNGTGAPDPTSTLSKDEFANANDPASPVNQDSTHHHHTNHLTGSNADSTTTSGSDERKKSWLGQKYASFQSAKRGAGVSDEELKKYTGKDRAELNDWAKTAPGVGGNQAAGRVGNDSGLAAGASWTA